MPYALRVRGGGMETAIPVEEKTVPDVRTLYEKVSWSLWIAMKKELKRRRNSTKSEEQLLNEWIERLNAAGIYMPTGCNLDEILENLWMTDMFHILAENEKFPIELSEKEKISEEEAKDLEDWETLTEGLVQKEADWM